MDTQTRRRKGGFTLIELLVVIAIIGILMGLLMGGVTAIREAARRRKAQTIAETIVHAIKHYQTDYQMWPGQSDAVNDDSVPSYATDHSRIWDALTSNPRNILYIELPQGVYVTNQFLDPWFQPYVIAMDENNDGATHLYATPPGGSGAADVRVQDRVAVLSWGSTVPTTNSAKWVKTW